MFQLLQQLWQYKIQVLPVLLCLGLYEIPALFRRLKKTYYVPIYFSIYPLRQINQDLSQYLAEDYYIGFGATLTHDEAEELRRKIIFTSVLSFTLDALVIPLLIGFVIAFFLQPSVFSQFLTVLIMYKLVTISLSLKNSRHYLHKNNWNVSFLIAIYVVYLGVVSEMLKTAYFWANPFVSTGNWSGLWSALSAVVFGKIFVQGIILAVFVTIFSNYIANRKIRESNVPRDR